jgi:hypothetical protein
MDEMIPSESNADSTTVIAPTANANSMEVDRDISIQSVNTLNDDLVKALEELDEMARDPVVHPFHEFSNQSNSTASEASQHYSRVKLDIFHAMDRIPIAKKHGLAALYFRALREALFIYDELDVRRVRDVLNRKGL